MRNPNVTGSTIDRATSVSRLIHKRSMFDRYNIIDEADLAAAVAKRFGNFKRTASIEASTVAPDSVTSSSSSS